MFALNARKRYTELSRPITFFVHSPSRPITFVGVIHGGGLCSSDNLHGGERRYEINLKQGGVEAAAAGS